MRRRFCQLNYRGMHQRYNHGAFFIFGAITPGPEFRGISRESGPRSPATGFQRFDPPLGHTLLHGEAEKLTRKVGLASPREVAWRSGGPTFGRRQWAGRAWRAGFRRRSFRAAGANGAKSRTRGRFRVSGAVRAPGFGAAAGAFSGAHREKAGRRRGKTGRSGVLRGRVRRALGGEKPPFAAKRAGNGAVAGRKLAEKAGGVCRVIRHLQGIFGRFRRKSWGFGKAFPRAYRKELPFAPFLCRWRTVIGGDNLVVRSGCYLGRKE